MSRELEALRRSFSGHVPGLLGARKRCAVLCPLTEGPEGLSLLFEVRSAAVRQPGEVCFPGGHMDPGEDAAACALRETEEELNIPPASVTVLGLPDFICNQRGFLLQPVLGLVSPEGLAALRPSPAEVRETFLAPLAFFRSHPPEHFHYALAPVVPPELPYEAIGIPRDYPFSPGQVDFPLWRFEGHPIWGMTGRLVEALVRAL